MLRNRSFMLESFWWYFIPMYNIKYINQMISEPWKKVFLRNLKSEIFWTKILKIQTLFAGNYVQGFLVKLISLQAYSLELSHVLIIICNL